ncbi:TAP-like protein-domain-containing protein [Aspergillus unguis]
MHTSTLFPATIAFSLFSAAAAKINWGQCDESHQYTLPSGSPIQCASLDVPFDYTDPDSNETLTLELVRVPAPLGSKGSILTNPGGPGGLGRQAAIAQAGTLIPLTGGEYDIVGWDTRGTNSTIPFECTDNPFERFEMFKGMVSANSSDTAVGTLWARAQIDATTCANDPYAAKVGPVLTTAFVARDMIQIVDALEEDGLLRYWGISYGTTLGATVAAMFPERMDKILLDGVQNPHEYYHASGNFEEWTDTDKAFSQIFAYCIDAGPKLCPLAAHNKTATTLEAMTWNLLKRVTAHPIALGSILVDNTGLSGFIQSTLTSMQGWPQFVVALDYFLFGVGSAQDIETIFQSSETMSTTPKVVEAVRRVELSLAGIYCADNQVRTDSLKEFMPTIHKLQNISSITAGSLVGSFMRCARWQIEPKETYKGSFEASTKTPLLLVGNTVDSHTPLKSAYNVSAGFEGSVVLAVDGNGHSSLTSPSACLLEKTRAFFGNGTLPDEGTVCGRDIQPFTGDWWPKVFNESGVDEAVLVYTA